MNNTKMKIAAVLLAGLFGSAPFLAAEQTLTTPVSIEDSLHEAKRLREEGEWLAAKDRYRELLAEVTDQAIKQEIAKELESVSFSLLFSKIPTEDSILYEVQPGDSLYKIAKQHNTTIELIMKANGLGKSTIYPGMKLKVMKSTFSILVNCAENILSLRQGEEIIKTYPVATGENHSTPLGTFTIENKLINPTWYRTGAVVPPGSPDNILGTRWMGFSAAGFGLHGTTMPESIGASTSAGCVRMLNQDVEELYDILPLKTSVAIVE